MAVVGGFFASGRVLPDSTTKLPSLIGCVIKGRDGPADVCARTEGANARTGNSIANKSPAHRQNGLKMSA